MENYRNDIGFDYATHSDFLIHWTGKDIDPPGWDDGLYSKTDEAVTAQYTRRLRDILKCGFWMTEDGENNPHLNAPKVPQTCFTELKLSQTRKHARKFGRLGIGVKRFFLFTRGGRPLTYYGINRIGAPVKDEFFEACRNDLNNREMLNFFKPMHGTKDENGRITFNYDLYSESEWRIIYAGQPEAEDPRDTDYFQQLSADQKKKLKYLLPLDYHLGLIVYPSVDTKRAAYDDAEIRRLIKGLCISRGERQWPIEVDLDACRNF